MAKIFVSYSHADHDFAHRLASKLRENRANVWIDVDGLAAGDSLISKIGEALSSSGVLLPILSKISLDSFWLKSELHSYIHLKSKNNDLKIIPILKEDIDVPLFLLDTKHIKAFESYRYTDFDPIVKSILDAIYPNMEFGPEIGISLNPAFAQPAGGLVFNLFGLTQSIIDDFGLNGMMLEDQKVTIDNITEAIVKTIFLRTFDRIGDEGVE